LFGNTSVGTVGKHLCFLNICVFLVVNTFQMCWTERLQSSASLSITFEAYATALNQFSALNTQGRRNGGALRGHCPPAFWKGGLWWHRCPYVSVS